MTSPRIEKLAEGVTLYCGDMMELLPTLGTFKLCVTDPPYKVTSGGSGGFGNLKGGSGWIKDSYDNKGSIVRCDVEWVQWLPVVYSAVSDPGHAYIFSNDRNLTVAREAAEGAGFEFHRLLVWDKKTALPNRWYIQNCEFVLFMKKGRAFPINECGTMALQSVFQRDQSDHPTEKPESLIELYVRNSTQVGERVLDPFMGSGTSGVAAVRNGRAFTGIEIDARWFDVACRRVAGALKRQDMFIERPAPAKQEAFL